MPKRLLDSLDSLTDLVGQEVAVTDWFTVTQQRIQQFADATLDHQWIHVDVDRAKRESPFGMPIAHGFPTLSLLPEFMHQAVGIKQVHDDIWLVSFMDYDLGYFDLETRVLEPLENPFGPKVSPM